MSSVPNVVDTAQEPWRYTDGTLAWYHLYAGQDLAKLLDLANKVVQLFVEEKSGEVASIKIDWFEDHWEVEVELEM